MIRGHGLTVCNGCVVQVPCTIPTQHRHLIVTKAYNKNLRQSKIHLVGVMLSAEKDKSRCLGMKPAKKGR